MRRSKGGSLRRISPSSMPRDPSGSLQDSPAPNVSRTESSTNKPPVQSWRQAHGTPPVRGVSPVRHVTLVRRILPR